MLGFAENDVKNLSNHKVSKIFFAASLRSSEKLEMSPKSLCSLYEHPLFHGIKTKDEAEALWKAKIEESGNPEAHIWFLMERDNQFESVIYGSRNITSKPGTDQFVEQDPIMVFIQWPSVERRNPHDLGQLARATILDNLNKCNGSSETNCCEKVCQLETDDCYLKRCCCDRIWKLIMKIDQLEIPASEKLMMKKLIPGALRLQKILNDRHYLTFVKYLNVVGGT